MSKIWITSDHHFGHKNIIKYCNRPYETVEEMDEDLVSKWNNLVHTDDTVYYLGDFSLDYSAVQRITPRLRGTKFLIHGNHDLTHPACTKNPDKRKDFIEKYKFCGWAGIYDEIFLKIRGMNVYLNHFNPVVKNPGKTEQQFKDKFRKYRPDSTWKFRERDLTGQCTSNKVIILHGHVHGAWEAKSNAPNDKALAYNVGIDVHGMQPIELDYAISRVMEIYPWWEKR